MEFDVRRSKDAYPSLDRRRRDLDPDDDRSLLTHGVSCGAPRDRLEDDLLDFILTWATGRNTRSGGHHERGIALWNSGAAL